MNAAPAVLVLDDEELLRESLALYLETQGFAVLQAGSAEEALALLPQHPCRAAVVDIRLPGLTGLDFIARAHADWPGMRFVVYTGSPGVRLGPELEAAGLGPEDIIAKPAAGLEVLAAALRRILGERGGRS